MSNVHFTHRFTVRALMTALRSGVYTSVGSYPTFFITADGGALSHRAVRDNLWQVARSTRDQDASGWAIVAHEANWEDPALYCDHTNERIPSAYAEDEALTA